MVDAICNNCFKEIKLKGISYIKKHNFCSRECYYEFKSKFYRGENHPQIKDKNTYLCSNCNKKIELLESQGKNKKNIFCSKQCRFDYDKTSYEGKGNPNYRNGNIKINCLNCQTEFERPHYQKGRAKYCSQKCKNEYWSNVLCKTPENQERLIQQGINAKKNQKNKFTKPEKIVYEYLLDKGLECIPQHPMCNRFVVDFFVPSKNMVIEVLGDYWHGNPIKIKKEKLTDKILANKEKDKVKFEHLTNEGFFVYMIWENDISKDLKNTMNFIE